MVPVVGIVVTRDGETSGGLARCLDSLRAAGALPLVLDDASADGTAALARAKGAEVLTFPPVGPDRAAWTGRSESAVRLDALRWAGNFGPEWAIYLDDDEWLLSPKTVAQQIREQIARPFVGCYYYRTLNFWGSMNRIKGWRGTQSDMRPRAWRWDPRAPLELFRREPHCGQVPLYALERTPAWCAMVGVGHLGYLTPALRERKAASYRKHVGPVPPPFEWSELLADENVFEFDWQTVSGLP